MKELSIEKKAIIQMMRASFRIALENSTFRWLFCWNGEEDLGFDCACCIGWKEEMSDRCGCRCHERFKELDALFATSIRTRMNHADSFWHNRGIDGKTRAE